VQGKFHWTIRTSICYEHKCALFLMLLALFFALPCPFESRPGLSRSHFWSCPTAQTVSRRFLIAEASFWPLGSHWSVSSGQRGTGAGFHPSISVFLCKWYVTGVPFSTGWDNRPIWGHRSKWPLCKYVICLKGAKCRTVVIFWIIVGDKSHTQTERFDTALFKSYIYDILCKGKGKFVPVPN